MWMNLLYLSIYIPILEKKAITTKNISKSQQPIEI